LNGNIRIIRNGPAESLVKVDYSLYMKSMRDVKLSCKAKGLYIIMLTEPQKLYSEHDFITPLDKIDSVTSGLKELIKNKYIEKFKNGYIVKGLFEKSTLKENVEYVYVIADPFGNYKIGLTYNIQKRLDEFRTAMPYEPKIIKIIQCSNMKKTEKYLHEKFKHKRIKGEWFNLSEKDIDMVQNNQFPIDIKEVIDYE
jgi:hypothetical protein